MSPVAALGAVEPLGALDEVDGAWLAGAVVGVTLPPQAAATSTAALTPMSSWRRLPLDRLVMVWSSDGGRAGAAHGLAEAVDRGSTPRRTGTRHVGRRPARWRSHRAGQRMGTRR